MDGPGPRQSLVLVDTCELHIKRKYEVIPSVVCTTFVLIGLINCFLGYRCFKMVMFLSGFVFGLAAVPLLNHNEPVVETHLGMETLAGIGLGVGVLCGLVTMLTYTMGLSGLQMVCLLALTSLVVVGQFCRFTPGWQPFSVLLVTSVISGAVTLQWQKFFIVLSTSVLGAAVMSLCVDYLIEMLTINSHVYDLLCQVPLWPLCWFDWVISRIWPVLSLSGAFVQWKHTTHGVFHTKVGFDLLDPLSKQKKQVQLIQFGQRGSRRRPEGTNRKRRPPLLKRYVGDVLAPSYIQGIRDKQIGTGSSSSISHTHHDRLRL